MGLNDSVNQMVERLQFNRDFPKYQFERSLDPLLSLFLEEFFQAVYGGEFTYIAAEFPIRKRKQSATDKEIYQSTNVDYLLLRKKEPLAQWYFVELKTDRTSERDSQLEILNDASGKKFSYFYDEVDPIKTRSKKKTKYDHLVESVRSSKSDIDSPVVSVCLTNYSSAQKEKYPGIEWKKLSEFDAKLRNNTKHPELWEKVKVLFEDVPGKAG